MCMVSSMRGWHSPCAGASGARRDGSNSVDAIADPQCSKSVGRRTGLGRRLLLDVCACVLSQWWEVGEEMVE